ncbi:probable nuclear transport factor 2 [Mercenaria mercenaria]|uniref:probable nuclear transport factor 2 n=1 Tax=Mercenaria mercenaria TaxID=6596 RepID=UPI001E1DD3C6|nr:probable nuclear transport factor 2 [Mercenaria mercenaria]
MNPNFAEIGKSFVEHFYTLYDTPGRKQELCALYDDNALLTFENDQKQGKVGITEKHMALTAQTKHAITTLDSQPTPDGGVIVIVMGQIQTEGEDKPLGFNHTFILKPTAGGSFVISNEVFRLAIHNF